ncbi:ABC transporter substrate-binding protein [Clostridioides mangenotii]|uniref:ABC transporter substrate-binding protein n=1 Tax=Metaclostridioides mangenotii TaxID=1540 RepID=UPI001C126270|nr:ABC transporter substrate-binding protein [Clostridioides mangenotii]MBU5306936.1 ABC transporter substrate-binding protein [Clostridioides mangenotii]
MKKPIAILTTMIITASIVSGCSNSTKSKEENGKNTTAATETESLKTSYPLTIEAFDDEGNTFDQVFNEAPKRVVTNNQSSTELLLDLGLKDSMVGTGDLDNKILDRLEEDYKTIPVVAEKGQVAKESVLGTNPDLVIGRSASFTYDKYGTISSLNDMGVNTYVQLSSKMDTDQSLDNIITDIKNIGKIFDIQEKANKYADNLNAKLDNIKTKVSDLNSDTKNVMIMVNYNDGQFGVFGANASLQTKMLETINAKNVSDKGGQLSIENLISLNPDAIVYVKANKNSKNDETAVKSLLDNKLIQNVSAIKDKNIIEVEYTELMGYSFRNFDCLEKIAKGLYPDTFK